MTTMQTKEKRRMCPKLTAAKITSGDTPDNRPLDTTHPAWTDCINDTCGMYHACNPRALDGVGCVPI